MLKTFFIFLVMTLASYTADFKSAERMNFSENHLYSVGANVSNKLIFEPFILPIKEPFRVSSQFGLRGVVIPGMGGDEGDFHRGTDLVTTANAKVYASASGYVIMHYPPPNKYFKGHPVFGGVIVIAHASGLYSLYGHLSKSYVTEGEYIKQGEVIGTVGNSGISTGPHLHFEIMLKPLLLVSDQVNVNL